MRVGREVERWQSADGKHLLRMFRRDSGFYFTESSEITEGSETFWTRKRDSGTYDSLEAAKKEALAAVPWLRDVV